jgi:large subunit ribosomal protein L15
MIKKLPKLRGHGKNRARTVSDARVTYVPVNLPALDVFAAGETVSPQTLVEKKVIAMVRGRLPAVKILGSGEITKALTIQGCAVSKGAKAAIEKAGGSVA